MWIKVDPANPPAGHMIAIYNDDCGAAILSKFDNDDDFYMAEDGWRLTAQEVLRDYSMWAPAPEGFEPHFMSMTADD